MHTTWAFGCMIFRAFGQLKRSLQGCTFMLDDIVLEVLA